MKGLSLNDLASADPWLWRWFDSKLGHGYAIGLCSECRQGFSNGSTTTTASKRPAA